MNRKHTKSQNLCGAVSLATLLVASPLAGVAAQEQSSDDVNLEEIVVTGSLIARNPLDVAAPLTTITSEQIKLSGSQDLGLVLLQIPSISPLGGRQANQDGDGNEGLSTIDLRGLGANRTLTLVNGKRHVAASQSSAAVDLSTIPAALIKEVQVITGGASAIYGSDAVSGVVNIILNDEFDGVQFDASYGRPFEGQPGENYSFSAIAGSSFAGEKGHFVVSAQFDKSTLLTHADQPFSNDVQFVPTGSAPGDGSPDFALLPRPADAFNREGVALLPSGRASFNENGTGLVPFPDRSGVPNDFVGAAFSVPCEFCFSFDPFLTVSPEVERQTLSLSSKYQLNDSIEAYMEAKYVNVDARDADEPRQGIFFGNPINVAENAFLDEGVRAQLLADGVTSFAFLKSFDELGNAAELQNRTTFRFVGGLRGDLEAGFGTVAYDAYYVYGQTEIATTQQNQRINGNLNAAIDAVFDGNGNIVCRGTLPGETNPATINPAACAPLNPFGFGSASQESLEFAFTDLFFDQEVTQNVAGVTFAFDSSEFLNLPAGPIQFAGGFEYREEAANSTADPLARSGAVTFTQATENTSGSFDVTEFFGEVSIPLLEDMPLVESLTIDAALRYADYSHAGNATAWKVGGVWQVSEDIRFRGTYSRAVRAPNLTEAFSPQQGTSFFGITDPCDADQIALEPAGSPVPANCQALGVAADHQNIDGLTIFGVTGGNPNLALEKSESWTVGAVLTPSFVPNLTVTVDYYSIDVTQAIRFLTSADILNTCVRNPSGPDATACSLIERSNTGQITSLASTFVNAAALETSGIDAGLNYVLPDGLLGGDVEDSMEINVTYTYLEKLDDFPFQNNPTTVDNRAGEIAFPKHRVNANVSYNIDNFQVRWAGRFIGDQSLIDAPSELSDRRDPANTGTKFYNDITVSADLELGSQDFSVFVGLNNVFDVEPPALSSLGFLSSAGLYDQLGRTVIVGGSFRF